MDLETFSKLITNSTEIVMVSMAFFAAFFAGIQAFFLLKAYELAKDYLPQHKAKLRSEISAQLSEKIIFNLYELNRLGESLFDGIHLVSVNKLIKSEGYSDIPEKFKNIHSRLELVLKNLEERSEAIGEVMSNILMQTDFLKDETAKKLAEKLNFSFGSFSSKLQINFSTIDSESEFQLEQMNSIEKHIYIKEKYKEFKRFIPRNFNDLEFDQIKEFRKIHEEFRIHLLANHRP